MKFTTPVYITVFFALRYTEALPWNRIVKRSFESAHQNGAVTNFDTGSFSTQHCLGNVEARKSYLKNRPEGENDPISKLAINSNKWVAINDVNLGPGFANCGKCVTVTITIKKPVDKIDHTATIGPLLVADRCSECPDNAIDLKSAAYKSLQIPNGRGSIQPDQNDGGTTTMTTSWTAADCSDEYAVVTNGGGPTGGSSGSSADTRGDSSAAGPPQSDSSEGSPAQINESKGSKADAGSMSGKGAEETHPTPSLAEGQSETAEENTATEELQPPTLKGKKPRFAFPFFKLD
jgi:hypothetical protein